MKKSFPTLLTLLLCMVWVGCNKDDSATFQPSRPAPVVNTPVLPPYVFAGSDIWLNTPMNRATLSASYTSFSGAPFQYKWRQLSGPNHAYINEKDSLKTDISGLIKGDYTFEFTVTNSVNMTGKDTVAVYVLDKQPPAGGEAIFKNLAWECPMSCGVMINCFSCYVPADKPFKVYIQEPSNGSWVEVVHINDNFFFDNYYYNIEDNRFVLYANKTSTPTINVKFVF